MHKAAFSWESRIIDRITGTVRQNGAGIIAIDSDERGHPVQMIRTSGAAVAAKHSTVDGWLESIAFVEAWRFDDRQEVETEYTLLRHIDESAIDERRVYAWEAIGQKAVEAHDDRHTRAVPPTIPIIVRRPRYVVVTQDYINREPMLVQLTRDVDGWPQAFTLNGIVYTRVVF